MRGNLHVRFLEGKELAMVLTYSTIPVPYIHLLFKTNKQIF